MTLYHLYTIAGLVLALALVYRLFRCAHAWELVDKTELQSAAETAKAVGGHITDIKGVDSVIRIFTRTVWIVMRCPKCGECKAMKLQS